MNFWYKLKFVLYKEHNIFEVMATITYKQKAAKFGKIFFGLSKTICI